MSLTSWIYAKERQRSAKMLTDTLCDVATDTLRNLPFLAVTQCFKYCMAADESNEKGCNKLKNTMSRIYTDHPDLSLNEIRLLVATCVAMIRLTRGEDK